MVRVETMSNGENRPTPGNGERKTENGERKLNTKH